jgi:hypothetical protein
MKKLVMTAAVLACAASIVSAQVYSQNIVGYAKRSIPVSSFRMISAQFVASNSHTNGITLGNAFSNVGDQDQVLFWNGSGYDVYTYYAGYGWYDVTATVPSDDVLIPQGTAVWAKSNSGTDLVISGEVPSSGSVTNMLSSGFNMVSDPYPVDMTLADIPTNSLSDQDQAMLWNGSGYGVYTYYAGYGWYDVTATIPSGSTKVSVGQGFWLKSASGGALIFNKPY